MRDRPYGEVLDEMDHEARTAPPITPQTAMSRAITQGRLILMTDTLSIYEYEGHRYVLSRSPLT